MKIGRNAPCPCGSGKKYKKCCLNKSVTPAETLTYRRLSKVLDTLMPKLMDHALATFGDMAPSYAMDEFFGWPEPDEVPNETTIDRTEPLFWPWFIFNWEYDRLDDENRILHCPEDTTPAEHFLKARRIDPRSEEARLIQAANRTPYSFFEVASAQPGQSVRVKDVLTFQETTVQEHLGSEALKTGDILFGRVITVEQVSMFLGLSAFALPPGMKPQLIDLRRSLSRGRNRLTQTDLYEWDMELRDLFWAMDRALHAMPKWANTEGDPMEFHKLIYDIDSPDLSVEKLSRLSSSKTLEEIRASARKDKNGSIESVDFDWSRKGNAVNKSMPNTVLGNIEIHKNRMTVTVNSATRAKIVQQEIENILGNTAKLRLDEITDVETMMQQYNDESTPPGNQLMKHPEVRQHIEQVLRTHWEDWPNQKIPALGNKTPKQAVRSADGREAVEALLQNAENSTEDSNHPAVEKEFINDVRRRLKLDRPFSSPHSAPESDHSADRIEQIKSLITQFGRERLHDAYTAYALNLCDAAASSRHLNIHRGRIDIWAASIVYAIAQLNFLFSSEIENHLTADEVCEWFKVNKHTVSTKAGTIRSKLNLFYDDNRFCAPFVTQAFQFIEDENGFIHSAAAENEGPKPIPLKPSPFAKKEPQQNEGKAKARAKKPDDRQLRLFDD